jgi:hypothetical protein
MEGIMPTDNSSIRRQKKVAKKLWLIPAFALLLTLMTVFLNLFLGFAGFMGGEMTTSFTYEKGIQPITRVVIEIPSDVAASLKIRSASPGWVAETKSDQIVLSEGQLLPGQTLQVKSYLIRYVKPQSASFTTTGTTDKGEIIASQGILTIKENTLLRALTYLEKIPWFIFLILFILAIIWVLSRGRTPSRDTSAAANNAQPDPRVAEDKGTPERPVTPPTDGKGP